MDTADEFYRKQDITNAAEFELTTTYAVVYKLDTSDEVDDELDTADEIDDELDTADEADNEVNTAGNVDDEPDTTDKVEEELVTADKVDNELDTSDDVDDKLDTVDEADNKLYTVDEFDDDLITTYEVFDDLNKAKVDDELDTANEVDNVLETADKVDDELDTADEIDNELDTAEDVDDELGSTVDTDYILDTSDPGDFEEDPNIKTQQSSDIMVLKQDEDKIIDSFEITDAEQDTNYTNEPSSDQAIGLESELVYENTPKSNIDENTYAPVHKDYKPGLLIDHTTTDPVSENLYVTSSVSDTYWTSISELHMNDAPDMESTTTESVVNITNEPDKDDAGATLAHHKIDTDDTEAKPYKHIATVSESKKDIIDDLENTNTSEIPLNSETSENPETTEYHETPTVNSVTTFTNNAEFIGISTLPQAVEHSTTSEYFKVELIHNTELSANTKDSFTESPFTSTVVTVTTTSLDNETTNKEDKKPEHTTIHIEINPDNIVDSDKDISVSIKTSTQESLTEETTIDQVDSMQTEPSIEDTFNITNQTAMHAPQDTTTAYPAPALYMLNPLDVAADPILIPDVHFSGKI